MGLQNFLSIDENSEDLRDNVQKLIYLLVADQVLNPDSIPAGPHHELSLNEITGRNAELISVFPEIFREIETGPQLESRLVSDVNTYLADKKSELLHIPGRVHELLLSAGGNSERKKQGSYYTPSHIIRYMIDISVKYLSQKDSGLSRHSPKLIDPACGGASFLIEYLNNLLDSSVPLETAIDSIYGVDLDNGAVLTAIFALTLAVSSKSQDFGSLRQIKHMWQSKIKKGNALCKGIGDLSDGIDWVSCFPDIFANEGKESGFDIVIGNPPYVSNKLISTPQKKYFRDNFQAASGQYDLSVLFLEQGINLLKDQGILTYITSNKFLAADYGLNLRRQLVNSCEICEIVDISTLKSFKNTAAYPVIIAAKKTSPGRQSVTRIYNISSWEELAKVKPVEAGRELFTGNSGLIMTTRLDSSILPIIRKIEDAGQRIPANKIHCGIANSGFGRWVKKKDQIPDGQENNYHPFIQAGHIKNYSIKSDDFIDITCFNSPKWLSQKGPKLVIPGISKRLTAALDLEERLAGRVYFITQGDTDYDLYYLTALFNSYLLNFYYGILYWSVHLEGGYLRFNSTYLANIPIAAATLLTPDKTLLINSLKSIGTELVSGNLTGILPYEKQCLANALVFKLYDISAAEAQRVMVFLDVTGETIDKVLSILSVRHT